MQNQSFLEFFGDKGDSLGSIPVEDIPWAYPLHDLQFGSDTGTGRFSTPKMGAMVRVVFEGDQYHPRYFFNRGNR